MTNPAQLRRIANVAETMVKDVGTVTIEGGRWDIYVGGAAWSSVREGDVPVLSIATTR